MNRNKGFWFAAFAVALVFGIAAVAMAATKIKWGATSVRSGLYANTVALGGLVNKTFPNDIQVTVVETGGFVENLARIQRRSVQLGPADASAGYAAFKGIIDYKGKQMPDLRSLWGGYVTPIHIVTTKKSGVTTLEGLNGLSFAMNPGTTSGRVIELYFEALGIKPNYKMMGLAASVDAMKAGVVDGWFKAGFKDAAIMDLESTMDINVIPITKESIDTMNQKYPRHGLSMMVPAGLFKAVTQDQLSFAYVISDFVHKDVSDDVVYKIVKAVYDNRKEIVAGLSTLREGRFDEMFQMAIDFDLGVPFHPGAAKFYKEVLNVTIPPQLIAP
jgi:uncharacterized protein